MFPNGQFRCFARREIWNDSIAIFVGYKREDGAMDALEPPTLKRIGPGQIAEPFLQLPPENAQQLMDELWSAGLRPTNGTGSAGAMAAVQSHLADMRKLVFERVSIDA